MTTFDKESIFNPENAIEYTISIKKLFLPLLANTN